MPNESVCVSAAGLGALGSTLKLDRYRVFFSLNLREGIDLHLR